MPSQCWLPLDFSSIGHFFCLEIGFPKIGVNMIAFISLIAPKFLCIKLHAIKPLGCIIQSVCIGIGENVVSMDFDNFTDVSAKITCKTSMARWIDVSCLDQIANLKSRGRFCRS